MSDRSLRSFTGKGYDKGRPFVVQALWLAVMNLVFVKWWFPARLRPVLLRAFGGQVGERVLIRHRVRVLWPWKLSIGDDCWIGEDAWLLDLEPITIEHDVCVSQGLSSAPAVIITSTRRSSTTTAPSVSGRARGSPPGQPFSAGRRSSPASSYPRGPSAHPTA